MGIVRFDPDTVRKIASLYGWTEIRHDQRNKIQSFQKNGNKINVFYTTCIVGTCLVHPRCGMGQLYRKVNTLELELVFKQPRVHLGGGHFVRYEPGAEW